LRGRLHVAHHVRRVNGGIIAIKKREAYMTKRGGKEGDSNPGHESDPLSHRPTLEEKN
jgi:hypothetical protein